MRLRSAPKSRVRVFVSYAVGNVLAADKLSISCSRGFVFIPQQGSWTAVQNVRNHHVITALMLFCCLLC
jgi:hypothetical protein